MPYSAARRFAQHSLLLFLFVLLFGATGPADAQTDPSSYPGTFVRVDDKIVFDATDPEHGHEPWVSDGTAGGTRRLADLCPGECGLVPFTWTGLTDHRAFFTSYDPTTEEAVLLSTDGTPAGTRIIWRGDSSQLERVPFVGEIRATDHFFFHIRELDRSFTLWASDGTPEGTQPLGVVHHSYGVELDGKLYFLGADPAGGQELWASDGTPEGTAPVGDLHPPDANRRETVSKVGNRVIYTDYEGDGDVASLWVSDGTAAGTRRFLSLPAGSFLRSRFSPLGPRAVFVVGHPDGTNELWGTDGTAAGTGPVTDAIPRPDYPGTNTFGTLWPIDGRVYFPADDGVHGIEPWTSDGTVAGTYMLADICPGECSYPLSFGYADGPSGFFAVGDDRQLWRSDGTPEGTNRAAFGSGRIVDFAETKSGGKLYYIAQEEGDPYAPRELWASDGLGTERRLAEFAVGGALGQTLGEKLLFAGYDDIFAHEPWVSDGTPEGTGLLLDIMPGASIEPPEGEWLTSPELADYRYKVRITPPGGEPTAGVAEPDCLPETACISGAVAGRPEVFLRVVGPKPNQFLWPTLAKFTTSRVEVWIEQIPTGITRGYFLAGARPGFDLLPGLFDRFGFPQPVVAAAGRTAAGRTAPARPTVAEQILRGTRLDGLLRSFDDSPYAAAAAPPPPPGTAWLSDPSLPGFRFQVRVTNQAGAEQATRLEGECIAETACVSAALAGRSELFLRVVGPKPNGRLWPTLVRFSTSTLEVWLEQTATGELRHYLLPGADPDGGELDGLFDRWGFEP